LEGGLASDGGGNPPTRLEPCLRSLNCVSSLAVGERHAIPPLVYTDPLDDARQALLDVLKAAPRVTLVAGEPDDLHAEFRSRVFGFVDDVAFFLPAGQPVIHVRSASRSGYYDFGVNYSFYLDRPPSHVPSSGFSCRWLVGMSEKANGKVRVGCGRYDWQFQATGAGLADRPAITIEMMQVLSADRLDPVLLFTSSLTPITNPVII
jgi:uncharacterized protein (DUF1499 family)